MIDVTTYKKHIYDVVGAIHEVHKELGAGLSEYCYQEGLQLQLQEQKIPFERELTIHPKYHGRDMEATYRIDFLCKADIIIECKAISELTTNHRAQLFNYMRLIKCPCGILVNFAPKYATIERFFYDKECDNIVGADSKVKEFL